jgi:hypothetical protein
MPLGLFAGKGLGRAMAGADQQIHGITFKASDGKGKEGKQVAIMEVNVGDALQTRGANVVALDGLGNCVEPMEKAVERGSGETIRQQFQDFFPTAHAGQPVMG